MRSVAARGSKLVGLGIWVCLAGWPAMAGADRWIVQYRSHTAKDRGARAAERARRVFRLIPAIVVDDADLARVQDDPDVVSIERDAEVHALEDVPTPDEITYGVAMVRAPEVWPITQGAGVRVAVLDTGMDLDHPDLPTPVAVMEVGDLADIGGGGIAEDDNGHGTHVAGSIAAVPNGLGVVGVAPGVDLLIGKVLDYAGHGSESGVIEGIEWAVANGADVINMSLGGAHGFDAETIAFGMACVAAVEAGVVVVAAAGNDGSATFRSYPAAFVPVIAVGSVNADGTRAVTSNFGDWIDVYAPGEDVLSTYLFGGLITSSGTSMASPHVAGVAALVLAARAPDPISIAELRCAIEGTAAATAEGNPLVVDAAAAVARALQPDQDCDGIVDALDACPRDPLNDEDADGACGDVDNCPAHNPDQLDTDHDGHGDLCDADDDNDHVFPDSNDNCPLVPNHDQQDSDGDGIGDVCDTGDDDGDGDGLPDSSDPCPSDPSNDADQDQVCGAVDNCPGHANPDQADADGDGTGDACEPDQDDDGLPDDVDLCPSDPDNDLDLDGLCGDVDNCPEVANGDQANLDGDDAGNACDADDDGDGLDDGVDNCPLAPNLDQTDGDQDGAGDACDLDLDDDGVLDSEDACPDTGGDASDASGCSIEQLCPCAGTAGGVAWKHHGAYVLCVSRTAARFADEGAIEAGDWTDLVAGAAQATCR